MTIKITLFFNFVHWYLALNRLKNTIRKIGLNIFITINNVIETLFIVIHTQIKLKQNS